MTPTDRVAEPVLVYDRIARNRRKTWFLVACSIAALAPFVFGISYFVAAAIVVRVSPEARQARSYVSREENYLKQLRASGRERTEWDVELENRIDERRAAAVRLEQENLELRYKLMPVVGLAVLAAMGILFWGIASEPTAKLLVQAGAEPAGPKEVEARRQLENLAIGAGLPVPKLYIIETSAPNAFAAGMSPERAVVAVTRGALNLLDRRELEGVLAHELSHIGNHDIRLNTIVATIALFLRIPYLMFRREMANQGVVTRSRDRFGLWRIAASPFGLYIFFVAPLVAAVIRAAVSREREFLADADAALLTRYPEGLLRALAKVGGAGSAVSRANPAFSHFYFANPIEAGQGWFSGNLMATHPPLADRIDRLVGFQGPAALAAVERAIQEGRQFLKDHPVVAFDPAYGPHPGDELAALNQGNIQGRVCRVISNEPVTVYETANRSSCKVAILQPGALLVAFDDPGVMRQVNTAGQTFGYLERGVKLRPINEMVPAEVYDPELRAAAEARLAVRPAAKPREARPQSALTHTQLGIAVAFGLGVFGVMLLVLWKLG